MSDESTVQTQTGLKPGLDPAYPDLSLLDLDLPDSDGEPMENERDRTQVTLLLDSLDQHWHDRHDFYAAGNMFLYYSLGQAHAILAEEAEPARPRRAFRGPDMFVVLNVDGIRRRRKWLVWEEDGRYPDVIFEFLSPSTRHNDQTTKKTLYERTFKTSEYYWYDPYDPSIFQGWLLHADTGYQASLPDARGWLWSPALQLWLGRWTGTYKRDPATWLRFYDQEGRLVLTPDELAVLRQQEVEAERVRVEAERVRAETERVRAETERTRAETAEAEVIRLRAELARLRGENH